MSNDIFKGKAAFGFDGGFFAVVSAHKKNLDSWGDEARLEGGY
jgi:hypothetical protein